VSDLYLLRFAARVEFRISDSFWSFKSFVSSEFAAFMIVSFSAVIVCNLEEQDLISVDLHFKA
jgi:hypothetical protein